MPTDTAGARVCIGSVSIFVFVVFLSVLISFGCEKGKPEVLKKTPAEKSEEDEKPELYESKMENLKPEPTPLPPGGKYRTVTHNMKPNATVGFLWGHTYEDPFNPEKDDWTVDLFHNLVRDIEWGLKDRKPDTTNMVKIPTGTAIVGCVDAITDNPLDCLPLKKLVIGEYWIDKKTVTNEEYGKCVNEKMCLPIAPMNYIPDAMAPTHPALVTIKQAERYCLWAGKRLPSEYEWERACRGDKGAKYPWGNNPPTPDRANICGRECQFDWAEKNWDDGYKYTAPVGSFAKGASPFGLLDPTGNVKEWVVSAIECPPHHHIARGASWYSTTGELPCAYRQLWKPRTRVDDKGIRCAYKDK